MLATLVIAFFIYSAVSMEYMQSIEALENKLSDLYNHIIELDTVDTSSIIQIYTNPPYDLMQSVDALDALTIHAEPDDLMQSLDALTNHVEPDDLMQSLDALRIQVEHYMFQPPIFA